MIRSPQVILSAIVVCYLCGRLANTDNWRRRSCVNTQACWERSSSDVTRTVIRRVYVHACACSRVHVCVCACACVRSCLFLTAASAVASLINLSVFLVNS